MNTIVFAKRAKKQLEKIGNAKIIEQIRESIKELKEFPKEGLDTKKLKNPNLPQYRLRSGDFRILFDFERKNKEINILIIADRKDCYVD